MLWRLVCHRSPNSTYFSFGWDRNWEKSRQKNSILGIISFVCGNYLIASCCSRREIKSNGVSVCITQCVIHHEYVNVVESQHSRNSLKNTNLCFVNNVDFFIRYILFLPSLSPSLLFSIRLVHRMCHMSAITWQRHTHTIALAYPFTWSNWWRWDRQFISMQNWARKWCRGTIQCAFDLIFFCCDILAMRS